MKKIYFSGSIRGGRNDANLYIEVIEYLKKDNIVLTEHIGDLSLQKHNISSYEIYERDITWLCECDLVIAECTTPSLGVGYELAYAEHLGKEVHVLYDQNKAKLSAMLEGNKHIKIYPYRNKEELYQCINKILD